MATDLRTAPEPSLSSLVGGIINDAQTLIKQELALAKSEVTEEIHKTKEAAISLGVGVLIAGLGAFLLMFMLVHLLNWATDNRIPLWGCFGIVGGVLTAIGAIMLFVGKNEAEKINLVPKQTAETMKENVQWIKNQT